MILRRLAASIRKQDWFTVFIETLIVVLGVFLGIQLGNLNDAGHHTRSERAVLLQLHSEIVAGQDALSNDRLPDLESGQVMRDVIAGAFGGDDSVPEGPICNFVQMSHQMPTIVGRLSAVDELISTGRLSQLKDEELRKAIAEYQELVSVSEARLPNLQASAVTLEREYPKYFEIRPFVDDETGEVRMRSSCDIPAMQADPVFLNAFARNLDVFDVWWRLYVAQPRELLADLHSATDRELGLKHEVTEAGQ